MKEIIDSMEDNGIKSKAQVLAELAEAVENMKLVREGKLQPRPAVDLFDEL